MRPARSATAAAAVLALAAVASAQDHVLFEVRGKDKVLGTIRPVDEREVVLGTLETGTTLKAAVKSTQKTGPVPTLSVLFADAPVPGVQVVTKGRGSSIVPFAVAATGVYKVVVSGDGLKDGDYQVSVSWTPQKTFSGTGTSAGVTSFPFSAPPDAKVAVTLAPAKGSPFVPDLLDLTGPAAAVVPLGGGGKASGVALPVRGDWTVHFATAGAEGPFTIKVVVTAPKPKSHTSDIRDSALSGAFGGGTLALGAVIDPGEGGTVGGLGSEFDGTPLEGSSVQVPPDSLGSATTIFVAQAEPYTPPGGSVPAGPAVEFGPSGTQFDPSKPATVTIPFDPNAFPGGIEALVVYVKDSNGDVVAVPGPYTFGPDTVTFTTSHFSTFLSANSGPRGLPAATYAVLGVGGEPFQASSGAVSVTTGSVQMIDGVFSMQLDAAELHFGPGFTQPTPGAVLSFGSTQRSGRLVLKDDSTIELIDSTTGALIGTARSGARDDVLLVEHVPGIVLDSLALFRRPPGAPTINTLAGKWHAFVWEFRGERAAAGATTRQFTSVADAGSAVIRTTGEITLDFAGTLTVATQFPGGDWQADAKGGSTNTFPIGVGRSGDAVIDLGLERAIALTPVLDGEAMFGLLADVDRGTGLGFADADVGVLFLVRESSRAKLALLVGDCVEIDGGVELHLATGTPPADQLGLLWRADSGLTQLAADRTFTQSGLSCTSGYPGGTVDPTFATASIAEPPGAKWSLASDGGLTLTGLGATGAVLPAGDFGVHLRRSGGVVTLGFLSRLRPAAPGK